MVKNFRLFLILAAALLFSACATVVPPVKNISQQPGTGIRQDIVHVVGPYETIWRIAKMYDVTIDDIARANSLSDPKILKMGQALTIPHAAALKPVIALYPSKKWEYIIIHHSATDQGNALAFHGSHQTRGFDRGLGYHFVIDNGSQAKQDGQIEVSPRWLKKEDGAHCNASGMNRKGIGICLVGNFNQEQVSAKQIDSLVYTVNLLRKYYKIPLKNIIGHRHVPGAKTLCPGDNFPWDEFRRRLR